MGDGRQDDGREEGGNGAEAAALDVTAPLAAPKPAPLDATAPLAAPRPVPAVVVAPAPLATPPAVGPADPLYFRRTKDFPRWATVQPRAHGEFVIEVAMRDVEERVLEISILDTMDLLELRAWINRPKRSQARKKTLIGVLGVGALAVLLAAAFYPALVPLVIVGTFAGVAMFMMRSDEAVDEAPGIELKITPEELTLKHEEFRLRSSPRGVRWFLVQGTELRLETDRVVPVLMLSREARMQGDWFQRYIEARCAEIASRVLPRPASSAPAIALHEEATDRVVAPGVSEAATEEVPMLPDPTRVPPLSTVVDEVTAEVSLEAVANANVVTEEVSLEVLEKLVNADRASKE